MSEKLILITGAAGFVGSHLSEIMVKNGFEVLGVDNFSTGQKKNVEILNSLLGKKFQFIEGDVTQAAVWKKLEDQVHGRKLCGVFHFASPASPPHYERLALETMWVNTTGLNQAMDFADQLKSRVIFASTSEIYGDPEVSPQPETYWGNVNTVGPRACYDEAKRFGEALIFTRNKIKGTKHGILRIFNTYGPRMNPEDGRVIINFLVQAKQGKKLSVYGDGKQTRSFCYVDDLVAGIYKFFETEQLGPINLGNEKEFTILELAQVIQKIHPEKTLTQEFFPLPKDDPKLRRPDLSKAKKLLSPWSPKITLEEGVTKMKNWLEGERL